MSLWYLKCWNGLRDFDPLVHRITSLKFPATEFSKTTLSFGFYAFLNHFFYVLWAFDGVWGAGFCKLDLLDSLKAVLNGAEPSNFLKNTQTSSRVSQIAHIARMCQHIGTGQEDTKALQPVAESILTGVYKGPCYIKGSLFALNVFQHTCVIPKGTTLTYQSIAQRIDHPLAVRAVANVLSRNQLAYLIPCHRIVPKKGGMGGYLYGSSLKADLLKAEKDTERGFFNKVQN